jgi:hypothetical protein
MKTCPKCKTLKKLTDYGTRKDGRPYGICKRCSADNTSSWRLANPEKEKIASRDWQKANPEKCREYRNKRRYGLSLEEYDALPKECAICNITEDLCIDHNHTTGEIRGVLCRKHNMALGLFNDDPALLLRAVDYLIGVLIEKIQCSVNEKLSRI